MNTAVRIDDRDLKKRLLALGRVPRDLSNDLRPTLQKLALHVQARAQERAPLRHGYLRGSAKTELKGIGTGLTAVVSFGGRAQAYAEPQHEREDYVHPKAGRAHFLHGDEGSAWNTPEQRMATKVIGAKVSELTKKALRGGTFG